MQQSQFMYIIRGIPLSGKTHLANLFLGEIEYRHNKTYDKVNYQKFSTNDYWYNVKFNYKDVPSAHSWNEGECTNWCKNRNPDFPSYCLIDNYNLLQEHVNPYLLIAKKYGLTPILYNIFTPLVVCLERNKILDNKYSELFIRKSYVKMINKRVVV